MRLAAGAPSAAKAKTRAGRVQPAAAFSPNEQSLASNSGARLCRSVTHRAGSL